MSQTHKVNVIKKPQNPKVPEIKEDTSGKNKIYYLDYFDTIKGKRQRPRVGPRRGFAEKEARLQLSSVIEIRVI